MGKPEEALEFFERNFNCAQSVLAALGPEAGLGREACLKVAGAFGGGMARRGETCGAVTGGLMALGLRHAAAREGDVAAKAETYSRAGAFLGEFKARHGSLLCRELLGCDLGTPEGSRTAAEKGLFATLCPRFVRSAVELLEKP